MVCRSLPVELWQMVVVNVPVVDDLHRMRLVSKALCAVATTKALRTILVSNTKDSVQFFSDLLQSSEFCQNVEVVIYRDAAADCKLQYVAGDEDADCEDTSRACEHGEHIRMLLTSVFSRLRSLTSLTRLSFTFHPKWDDGLDPQTRDKQTNTSDGLLLQLALIEAAADAFPPTLTSLTLNNLVPMHDELYGTPSVQALLEHLVELRISVASYAPDVPTYSAAAEEFWDHTIADCFLDPATSLRKLALHNDSFYPPPLPITSLNSFGLTRLSLKRMFFECDFAVDDFVEAYRGLETLDLLECFFIIPTFMTIEDTARQVVWESMYRGLTRMPSLEKLVVEQMIPDLGSKDEDRERVKVGYVRDARDDPEAEYDYVSFFRSSAVDDEMLKDLQNGLMWRQH
ncbi:hypothetical protein FA95DRAFT_1606691 [Auriscalpium vulgare]|uniref:Uncharacterized protein n=1 Tax=Auriscalpium vulgare TaxID=40419 RepID=A0ACB8RSA8_9AGAM|nr:hypothetical protein FA95DRAFT_1606691 [Auriscalpium vulgare]